MFRVFDLYWAKLGTVMETGLHWIDRYGYGAIFVLLVLGIVDSHSQMRHYGYGTGNLRLRLLQLVKEGSVALQGQSYRGIGLGTTHFA